MIKASANCFDCKQVVRQNVHAWQLMKARLASRRLIYERGCGALFRRRGRASRQRPRRWLMSTADQEKREINCFICADSQGLAEAGNTRRPGRGGVI